MRFSPWGVEGAVAEPTGEGYNSQTWHIQAGTARYVAKRVGGDRTAFEAGLRVAELLEERGFPAGGPVRTRAGELTVSEEGECLALLRYVPGVAVAPDTPEGLAVWGRAMGRIHSLLVDVPPPVGLPLAESGSPPDVPVVAGAEWVGPAIAEATEAIQRLSGLTIGIYHGDGCEPRRDPATGETSVIDWGTAGYGPLLIDVGTTCWYLQSDYQRKREELAPFLEAYLAAAPIQPDELAYLDAFIQLRAAMSGWYFAWRIDQGYTNGADAEWNAAGLAHARRLWESLGG